MYIIEPLSHSVIHSQPWQQCSMWCTAAHCHCICMHAGAHSSACAGSFDEDEQRAMMESLRNASKNTMFDKWLSATIGAPSNPAHSPPRSPVLAPDGDPSPLGEIAPYLQSPLMTGSSQTATLAAGTFRPGWEVRPLPQSAPSGSCWYYCCWTYPFDAQVADCMCTSAYVPAHACMGVRLQLLCGFSEIAEACFRNPCSSFAVLCSVAKPAFVLHQGLQICDSHACVCRTSSA